MGGFEIIVAKNEYFECVNSKILIQYFYSKQCLYHSFISKFNYLTNNSLVNVTRNSKINPILQLPIGGDCQMFFLTHKNLRGGNERD